MHRGARFFIFANRPHSVLARASLAFAVLQPPPSLLTHVRVCARVCPSVCRVEELQSKINSQEVELCDLQQQINSLALAGKTDADAHELKVGARPRLTAVRATASLTHPLVARRRLSFSRRTGPSSSAPPRPQQTPRSARISSRRRSCRRSSTRRSSR